MSQVLAYINGRWLPQDHAGLPLHDAGFVQGATVTDLCRTFRHQLYRLSDHLQRFRRSCDWARIPQPVSDEELTRLADELVEHNSALIGPDEDLALVLFATPGPIGYYGNLPGGPGEGQPTLGLHTFTLPFSRYQSLFEQGAHLVTPRTRHVPAACLDPRIKMRSRLFWWLAEQEAREQEVGAHALLLDLDGHVTETAGANFLIVRKGVVVSPPPESILGGISLSVVKGLCDEMKLGFEERPLLLDECLEADEALLACTSYCVAGVSQINGKPYPWPGPVQLSLLDAWSRCVGVDIRRQILANR